MAPACAERCAGEAESVFGLTKHGAIVTERSKTSTGQFLDTEHINASYNAGVLKLELQKKPEAQPKQIKVNVAGGEKAETRQEEPELVGAR